ncbi:MAG: TetR family transcriptional regulator [Gaiellales bacterium]
MTELRRPRASLSKTAILDAAIELLDRDGVAGLTLRGLAAELGGGLGSVYWHVAGKEALVDLAIDAVLARALEDVEAMRDGRLDPAELRAEARVEARDPAVAEALTEIRRVCHAVYRQLELHPWVAPKLATDAAVLLHSFRVFDLVGGELRKLPLTDAEQYHGVLALFNYVNGVGADMSSHRRPNDDGPPEPSLEAQLDTWLAEAPGELPFVEAMRLQFLSHDPYAEFAVGLDLLLAGLRTRVEGYTG